LNGRNFKAEGSVIVKLEFSKIKNNHEFMVLIDKCKLKNKKFSERVLRTIVQQEIDSIDETNAQVKLKKLSEI
jgi:hypothetical protein